MNKKRIYIAGCGGMLGEAFYQQFKDDYIIKCSDKDVTAEWLSFLDIRNFRDYRNDVMDFHPDYLFHLAAYTDLEWCERNEEETYLTNTLGVENAVYIANSVNIPILYISTAGIFDGEKDCYDDWAVPNPLSVYGRSKYLGERCVVENANRYLVCRAGWMMGGGPSKDKKFIQKIMSQLKQGKKELIIVNDKNGTPTYTYDFALTVKNLIKKEYWGVYNCVCNGQASRLDVCKEMLRILGLEESIKVREVNSDYFSKEYYAVRPASECLLTRKLNLRGVNNMRNWQIALKEYLENYYKGYLD